MSFSPSGNELRAVFDQLLEEYGRQQWWPAQTRFEVMVGAILTQNTAWANVERAIHNLKQAGALSLQGVLSLPIEQLAELIRPSGYFNIKAQRLRNLCNFLQESGGENALREMDTPSLRKALLAVNGVGPETADDILLYAFERPVFVIDAYTRRLFSRLGMADGSESYEQLGQGFESALGLDSALFNEYHGLIVRHAKEICGTKPNCNNCCLAERCIRKGVLKSI
jgi:endonuclease-3 related protein